MRNMYKYNYVGTKKCASTEEASFHLFVLFTY